MEVLFPPGPSQQAVLHLPSIEQGAYDRLLQAQEPGTRPGVSPALQKMRRWQMQIGEFGGFIIFLFWKLW